jgi:hypothetical protein
MKGIRLPIVFDHFSSKKIRNLVTTIKPGRAVDIPLKSKQLK